MNEAQLTRKLIKQLRERGYYAVKIHGGPHQQAGTPDIVGCAIGFFFGFEVKMPGKEQTLTKLQARALKDISEAGGIFGVVTSIRDIDRLLEKFFWEKLEANGD